MHTKLTLLENEQVKPSVVLDLDLPISTGDALIALDHKCLDEGDNIVRSYFIE